MNSIFGQLTTILTDSPGNLIYHLVLAFSVAGALQVAARQWRASRFPQLKRAIIGFSVLLVAQLISFVISALAWQSIIDPTTVLPPLDRAITFFSLVWVAWLWSFPEPNRAADAANALLTVLSVVGLILSYLVWLSGGSNAGYTHSASDIFWQFASLLFAAVIGITLFLRRPNGWNNGLLFMVLAVLGHGIQAISPQGGDFPGVVRIFYLAAYPSLMTLTQRFPHPSNATPVAISASNNAPTQVQKANSPLRERRRYSTDPKTFHALLALAAEVDPSKTNHAITRAIAQTMLADLCFLIYLNEDSSQMILASGYDLIREENLDGSSLNKATIPMLANALQRGRPLRLPQSSTSPDMQGLGDLLGLKNPGHLLSAPIMKSSKEPIGGVLLLSPYSNRLWNADDQAFLVSISESLFSIIERGQEIEKLKRTGERAQEVSDSYRVQLDALRKDKQSLEQRLREIEEKLEAEDGESSGNLEELMALQETAQNQIKELHQQNEALRAEIYAKKAAEIESGTFSSGETKYLESELKNTLKEVARLQNLLAKANLRILELENSSAQKDSDEQAAVVASIAQELRQPLSSIVGYTDLLLGESVGILGALQRKFVERIKSSIERVSKLIDDIIQVTTLEVGLATLKPEPVDLNEIIDNAMAYTSNQTREKNLSINLDLPKVLEPIHADRDALQQILIHLLQNAGAASPVDGTVTLSVNAKDEKGQSFVLIRVSDTGGGIPAGEITRVFSRLYRAENALIPGVGDTGVGLSIAKTLTEAQNGRIWVETKEKFGSTFSVLLPVARVNATET